MLLSVADRIDVQTWLRTLQYREIHALVWGFGLGAGATVAQAVSPGLGGTLAKIGLGLLVWAFTGSVALAADAGKLDEARTGVGLPHPVVLAQLYREPHYYVGGLVAGVLVGGAAVLVGSVVLS